jgi:hypothetical protein
MFKKRRREFMLSALKSEKHQIAEPEPEFDFAHIKARLDLLAPESRDMLLMMGAGFSTQTMAEVFRITPSTVRLRMHRVLKQMRQVIETELANTKTETGGEVGLRIRFDPDVPKEKRERFISTLAKLAEGAVVVQRTLARA